MKTLITLTLTLLLTTPAFALTVKEVDIAGKTNLITLKEAILNAAKTKVLADQKGMSIYTFDLDSAGKSVCKDTCLVVWPVVEVANGSTVKAPYGTIQGNNGKTQLTLNGLPLYYFHQDKTPADILGQYPTWQLISVQ